MKNVYSIIHTKQVISSIKVHKSDGFSSFPITYFGLQITIHVFLDLFCHIKMHFTVLTNSVLGLALLSLLQAREEERGLGMRFDLSN